MQSVYLLLSLLLTVTLVSCGDGGGGGGGSPPSGRASFGVFDTMSSQTQICLNSSRGPATPTTAEQCSAVGGTWDATQIANAVTTTTVGSYNEADFITDCAPASPSIYCKKTGVLFELNGGALNATSERGCLDNGGEVVVTCSTTANIGTRDAGCGGGFTTNTPINCSAVSGTYYTELKHADGLIFNVELQTGRNVMEVVIDYPSVDHVDVLSSNPALPVSLSYTLLMLDSNGDALWKKAVHQMTTSGFDDSGANPTFTFNSPIGATNDSSGVGIVIKNDPSSSRLYYK